MDFGIASFAGIAVICFLVAETVKATDLDNKWLPVVCGISGAVLGLAALYLGVTDFPATDPLNAVAVGVVSGLAATGAHQTYKQLNKKEENV